MARFKEKQDDDFQNSFKKALVTWKELLCIILRAL